MLAVPDATIFVASIQEQINFHRSGRAVPILLQSPGGSSLTFGEVNMLTA